jgi:hypothetical protein
MLQKHIVQENDIASLVQELELAGQSPVFSIYWQYYYA